MSEPTPGRTGGKCRRAGIGKSELGEVRGHRSWRDLSDLNVYLTMAYADSFSCRPRNDFALRLLARGIPTARDGEASAGRGDLASVAVPRWPLHRRSTFHNTATSRGAVCCATGTETASAQAVRPRRASRGVAGSGGGRSARSHLSVKKSGGAEGVPSDGAGSHLTGFRAACVGSGVAGAGTDLSPGACLLVDFAASRGS